MRVLPRRSVSASFPLLSGSPVIFHVNVFCRLVSRFPVTLQYITFCIYLREEFGVAVRQGSYLLVVFFHGVLIFGSILAANFSSSCGFFLASFSF